MKTIRTILCLGLSLMLALSASLAYADDNGNKTYAFTPAPAATIPAGATSGFVLTIKNTGGSDDGTSFKSLILTAPPGVKITSISGAATTTTLPAQSISVVNVTTRPGSSLALTLGLSATCGGGGSWSASVYTGNPPPNGSTFTNPAFPSTSVASCALSFGTQPTSALALTKITGSKYKPSGSPVTVTGSGQATVTLTATCASGSVGTVTAALSGGVATFTNLVAGGAASNCKLSASAPGYQGVDSAGLFQVNVGSLKFAPSPANVLSGAVITSTPFNNPKGSSVAVQLLLDGVATNDPSFDGTQVSVSSVSPSCVASGATASVTSGVATFGQLTAVSIAPPPPPAADLSCTLGASVTNFTSPAPAPFTVKAPSAAPLACGGSMVATNNPPNASDPGHVDGARGVLNKDGLCPALVNYSFVTDPNSGKVVLIWDTTSSGQPNAAFSYTVTSKPVPLPTGFPAVRQPKVAWKVYDAVTGGVPPANAGDPVFIPAQACAAPILPKQYGTASIDGVSTSLTVSLTVNANTLPSTPFPIVMEAERMLVTAVNGSTWTVQRGDGMTTPASHTIVPVMSTPLPLLTGPFSPTQALYYTVGKVAQMCIASQSWISMGFQPGVIPVVPQIVYSTTVFDIGDGVFSDE